MPKSSHAIFYPGIIGMCIIFKIVIKMLTVSENFDLVIASSKYWYSISKRCIYWINEYILISTYFSYFYKVCTYIWSSIMKLSYIYGRVSNWIGDHLGETIWIKTSSNVIMDASSFWYTITWWEESILIRDYSTPHTCMHSRPVQGYGNDLGPSSLSCKWGRVWLRALKPKMPQNGFWPSCGFYGQYGFFHLCVIIILIYHMYKIHISLSKYNKMKEPRNRPCWPYNIVWHLKRHQS